MRGRLQSLYKVNDSETGETYQPFTGKELKEKYGMTHPSRYFGEFQYKGRYTVEVIGLVDRGATATKDITEEEWERWDEVRLRVARALRRADAEKREKTLKELHKKWEREGNC